jgi:hypothetical protein
MANNLPPQSREFLDKTTGRVDPLWYLFFRFLKGIKGGAYTVTSADDTANTTTIATGLMIASAVVQIVRAGKVVSSDPSVSYTGANLTIANGSTYVLTTGDVINYIVIGA